MFEVHLVQWHQIEAELLSLVLLAKVVKLQHAVIDDLWNSFVGDLVFCLAVDHFFDVCVENTIHFFHGLDFLGDHIIVFLYFEDDFHILFQVFNLIDVTKAALVNCSDYFVSVVDDNTIESVETLPFTVDGLNNFVHILDGLYLSLFIIFIY